MMEGHIVIHFLLPERIYKTTLLCSSETHQPLPELTDPYTGDLTFVLIRFVELFSDVLKMRCA